MKKLHLKFILTTLTMAYLFSSCSKNTVKVVNEDLKKAIVSVDLPIVTEIDAIEFAKNNEDFRIEIDQFLQKHDHWKHGEFFWRGFAKKDGNMWMVYFKSNFSIPQYECSLIFSFQGNVSSPPKCEYDPRK